MKTLLINEPRHLTIMETEKPVAGEGEALLKVLYGGICGSDLGTYRGTFAYSSYPRIPGHEFSAEIMEINGTNTGLRKGMTVTANPYFNCGKCYSCRRGYVNCCESNQTMGVQRDGAFSEYIVLPVERIHNGFGIAPKTLAMIEPFCISYHSVKRASLKKGEKILILGAGTIGIFAAQAAKRAGAQVYISDISTQKLQIAENFDIDGTILNSSYDSFISKVNEITDGNGFDVTFEAVGLPSTFQSCIDAASFAGRVVLIGVGKQNLDFNFTIIQKKELSIFGSRNAINDDFIQAIEFVKNDIIVIDQVISKIFSFAEAAKAFEEFDRNAGRVLKILIEF